ncbi:hypothetical protein [Actinomadura sediminis]|uniref:DUF4231 domain-containing protein n=1 Tax=Actinomadura sediminis TaxID=1038904 RepID=A0ABW3F0I5_9ACTN
MPEPREGVPETPVQWASPGEFGQPAATDIRTGVATPLLAGFSIALLASVGQGPGSFRWAGAAIFFLLLAGGLFTLSLQVGFRSRSKLYSRDEALSWGRINQLPEDVDERVRAEVQRRHVALWRRSQRFVQISYNAGIATLAFALSLAAAPPARYGDDPLTGAEQSWRWAATTLGLIFTIFQVGWIVHDEFRHRKRLREARQRSGGVRP